MTLAQAFERRGIEIGLQQGMQRGEACLLIRLLERKFGKLLSESEDGFLYIAFVFFYLYTG